MANFNKQPVEWMSVLATYNLAEAQIVAGRLQYEGIPALVNAPIGSAAMGIDMGAIHVLVHPQNYERALEILHPEPLDELPETTDDITYKWDDDDDDE
jgi:hypothetical protein